MSKLSIQFARSLADVIAADELIATADELALVAGGLSSDSSSAFLRNTAISAEQRADVVAATLTTAKVSASVIAVIRLVIQHGGTANLIRDIATSFRRIAEEKSGVATATIESATKLSAEQVTDLTAALAQMTGKEIRATTTENDALLAGVRVTLGGDVYDLSLAGKLQQLKQAIA